MIDHKSEQGTVAFLFPPAASATDAGEGPGDGELWLRRGISICRWIFSLPWQLGLPIITSLHGVLSSKTTLD